MSDILPTWVEVLLKNDPESARADFERWVLDNGRNHRDHRIRFLYRRISRTKVVMRGIQLCAADGLYPSPQAVMRRVSPHFGIALLKSLHPAAMRRCGWTQAGPGKRWSHPNFNPIPRTQP